MSVIIHSYFEVFLFIIISILIPRYKVISEINLIIQGKGE